MTHDTQTNPMKALRQRCGYTLARASMAWGVGRSTLASLEDGSAGSITPAVLERLALNLVPVATARAAWAQDLEARYQAWRAAAGAALRGDRA